MPFDLDYWHREFLIIDGWPEYDGLPGVYSRSDVQMIRLWKKQTGLCALCQKPIDLKIRRRTGEEATIDHIIPCCKGGLSNFENIQLAHRSCNARKGKNPA